MKFSKELKQYAHLVIKTGVNVQPDQVVYISCDVQASYFAELLTMEAYKAKAKKVIVDFYDQNISKLHFVNQSIETLLDIKKYDIDHLSVPMVKDKACRIKVLSELPGVYSTVDGNKLQAYSSKMSSLLKPVTEIIMKGSQQWCVVAYPNKT
jgi:aminopeptidase